MVGRRRVDGKEGLRAAEGIRSSGNNVTWTGVVVETGGLVGGRFSTGIGGGSKGGVVRRDDSTRLVDGSVSRRSSYSALVVFL